MEKLLFLNCYVQNKNCYGFFIWVFLYQKPNSKEKKKTLTQVLERAAFCSSGKGKHIKVPIVHILKKRNCTLIDKGWRSKRPKIKSFQQISFEEFVRHSSFKVLSELGWDHPVNHICQYLHGTGDTVDLPGESLPPQAKHAFWHKLHEPSGRLSGIRYKLLA